MKTLGTLLATAILSTAIAAQPVHSVTQLGAGCGPILDASFVPNGANNKMTVTIANAWAGEKSLTFWGDANIAFTFPGTMCTLWTLPVWQHPELIKGDGTASWSRAWPREAIGFYHLQTLVYRFDQNGELEFELSNAIRVARE